MSLLTSAVTKWLEGYAIEASTALPTWNRAGFTVTVTNQSGAMTFPAPPGGAVEHLDPAPPASPAFYRIAAP